jgi:arylsulfatase A
LEQTFGVLYKRIDKAFGMGKPIPVGYQKMKQLVSYSIVFFLLGCTASKKARVSGSLTQRKNIILVLADDLGRNDLACYGNPFIETPNLDAMAKEGMQFMNAYAAAPLCSPTRASIITGNNPARINLTEHLHGYAPAGPNQKLSTPRIETGLPPQLTTIPEALKTVGYHTAHFGKWHLGGGPSSPAAQGFEKVYGGGVEGLPNTFFYPFFNGTPYKDLIADTKEGDYLDDALTSKALQYIGHQKDSSFFITLNFYAPHVPIEGKPALVNKYRQKRVEKSYQGLPEDEYAAMVENIDYNVGRLLAYLKQQGLDKNTVVFFVSDNGGLDVREVPAFAKHTPPTINAPLRSGKGYIYEGGIRTPWIVWGPSVVKSNTGQQQTMVTTDDVFNTCMQLAHAKGHSPDGTSILPALQGKPMAERNYCLHFPHYSPQHGKPGAVLRNGRYKLIEWYEDGQLELYDLQNDEGERNNIAAANPALVQQLREALNSWKKSVGAKPTAPNPHYTGQ